MSDASPQENSSKQTEPEQPPANLEDKNDALIAALTSINQANRHADDAYEETRNRHENRMFRLERAGVIGLAIYCIFTALEWHTFNSERQTMEKEFKMGQTNAQREAEAAERQLSEMQSENRLDQRAWVMAMDYPIQANATSFEVHINFKNTGKTPALNLTYWSAIQAITNVDSLDKRFKTIASQKNLGIAPPDVTVTIGTLAVTTEQAKLLPSINRAFWCAFGRLEYDDIFHCHHWTQFCIGVSPDLKVTWVVPDRSLCDDSKDEDQK